MQTAERAVYQSILVILKEQQKLMQHLSFRIGSREGEGHTPLAATQSLNGAVQKLEDFLVSTSTEGDDQEASRPNQSYRTQAEGGLMPTAEELRRKIAAVPPCNQPMTGVYCGKWRNPNSAAGLCGPCGHRQYLYDQLEDVLAAAPARPVEQGE